MKILITGANGAIGRHIVADLITRHELVLLSRQVVEPVPGTKAYQADLARPDNLLPEIMAKEKPEVVIHLAALMGPACDKDPTLAKKINVESTILLATLSAECEVKKFIFVSTGAIYNQTQLSPTDEDSNINPKNEYARTKLQAEEELKRVLAKSNTAGVVLRLFNVYGPGLTGSLVYKLVHSSPAQPITLKGMENYYRDYIYIGDVVRAVDAALSAETGKFLTLNVGSGVAKNNKMLVDEIESLGAKPHYVVGESESMISWADISKAKAVLGFAPNTALNVDL